MSKRCSRLSKWKFLFYWILTESPSRTQRSRPAVVWGGQGPIWASECPGSLMWHCTCLAFQSLQPPKPRTRPRHQRARPVLTLTQQQPGHLWSSGSPGACACMCACSGSVWDIAFQPMPTPTQAVFGRRTTGSGATVTSSGRAGRQACGCILKIHF